MGINSGLSFIQLVAIGFTLAGGGLLQGSIGFGFGLFVMPLLLLFTDLSLPNAMAIMAAAVLFQSLMSIYHLRHHGDWKPLIPLMVIAALSLQLGVWILSYFEGVSKDIIRQAVGWTLMAILILFWVWKVKPKERVHPIWGIFALILSGLVSGAVGMGGPFVVLWVMAHQWSNKKTRVTLMALTASIVPLQIGLLALQFGTQVLHYSVLGFLSIPLVFVGTAFGLWLGNRIPMVRLRQISLGLLFLVAIASIFQPWRH